MKNLLIIIGLLLFCLPLQAQHVSGELKGTQDSVTLTVYTKTIFGWKETKSSTQRMYLIRLKANKENQVWFTDNTNTTKILFIPKNTVQKHLYMNIDFSNTQSALIEGTENNYTLHLLDFDFTVLECPVTNLNF